ncbi:unannotated protein [freshwater metagenome]|uniref:Unannotated protein n=1 Tax=freshwater metagenome TaxID=449393 RepID=A0A6J7T253_9ZZZZ|nr:GNAT family N-acetyltransferase [Actinomycetota bacterium]
MPIIRNLALTDIDAIMAINEENVPAVGQETREAMLQIFGECNVAIGAEVGGNLVGFCMLLPPQSTYASPNYLFFCENYEDFIYLDRVAITSSHQGQGIGKLLYREVESRTDAPWFTLEVNVQPPNEGSLRFHAREGFVEVAQLETRPGKIVSLMAKKLH